MERAKPSKKRLRRAGVSPEMRDAVQLRDAFTCVYCRSTGNLELRVILTIDHVIPAHFGGSDEASNLVTACDLCNWMKGIYPLDLWAQLAERLGYGEAAVVQARVQAALARKLPKRK